jgi:eukaryotic-like serine/threonine-protein kinase
VMEYLRGQTLGQLLYQQRQLPVERAVNIITQVCDGLSVAHRGVTWQRGETARVSECLQVVHRDLKPDNIFLVSTEHEDLVKILDFGIAKIGENQESAQLTNRNTFAGTYHYAAPEQLKGANIDERADIYSLGIIIYEILSGTDPFGLGLNTRHISEDSWTEAHTSKKVQSLQFQPGLSNLSPLLDKVVLKCLKKSPSDRFISNDNMSAVENLKLALEVATKPNTVSLPIPSQDNSENQTTVRPLTPSPQPLCDRSSEKIVESVDLEVPHSVLSLGKDSLLKILTEIIGPIAYTLLEEKAAQASSPQELINKLLPYLSLSQQEEFKRMCEKLK